MQNYKEVQINIFENLLNNIDLTGSAKNQIRIFIDLLNNIDNIGFDTTSALFYGFLNNPDFIDSSTCPLTQEQIKKAKIYFLEKSLTVDRAKEYSLLQRVCKLPLSNFLGEKLDLRDLALSFLTYASKDKHITFDYYRVERLYHYLDLPNDYYLNVFDLYYDFDNLNIKYDDFIINLSRLKSKLFIPSLIKNVSVYYNSLYDHVMKKLPYSLNELSGTQLEDFIMEGYYKAGYKVIRIGNNAYTPDGGLDIIAYIERPLEGDLRFAIQCKAWKDKINVDIIRSFNTSINQLNANKGIIIGKNGFTSDSIKEVDEYNYRIELMDYIKLSNQLRSTILKE